MAKIGIKVWILIFCLGISLISIFIGPNFLQKGVLVTSVDSNSSAYDQGLRTDQIITSVDGKEILSIEDFSAALKEKYPSTENVKTVITTKNSEIVLFSKEAPEITVSKIPKTTLQAGLDLAGGSRAIVKAQEKELDSDEIEDLVEITRNRLNQFGLKDLKVVSVSDLQGNNFMLIEIAGTAPGDLESLISDQGKFEAKIGDEVVFVGGEKDIASICKNDATCAYVENPQQTGDGNYFANFRFSIYLSEDAAKRHAEITDKLEVNLTSEGNYLSQPLDLYVDDNLLSSLRISESLKGQVTTQISISGSGAGATPDEAYKAAQEEMHKLQTILITGSLPYKLEVVKLDTISPVLGDQFVKSILIAGVVALLSASLVVFVRYRSIKSSLAVILVSFSEIIIILGISSLTKHNLDLPSIAGILATIGTGFDDQIVILDEASQKVVLSLKQKLKRAFGIIMGAYFTALVSLLPIIWAGAGLFKGFAITTIIGISVGVFITRPAFSEIVKKIKKD